MPIFIQVLARILRHIATVNFVEKKSIHCFLFASLLVESVSGVTGVNDRFLSVTQVFQM